MGFDPTIRSETFGGTDKSWIRMRKGLDTMLPIMLDMSTFASTHLINGRIPSGTVIAKILDAGGGTVGFYGPYTAGSGAGGKVSERQKITVDATGGTFTITWRGGTTAAIAFNATPQAVMDALALLAEVNVGDIIVTGGPGNAGGTTPYFFDFAGQYAGVDVAAMTTTATSLTGGAGTAAVATVTAGGTTATGLDVMVGHLFEDVAAGHYPDVPNTDPSTHADVAATLFWEGVVIEAKLPNFAATTGKLDAAAKADVAGRILYV